MEKKITDFNGIPVLMLGEDIVTENVEEFNAVMLELVNNENYQFIINLENVNFMCSSGLGVIVSVFKRVRENKGDIKLVHMNDRIHRLFEITRLNKVIDSFNSIEQAAESFNK